MIIRTDLHVHTKLSSCAKETAVAEAYVADEKTLGITCIGFADHMWDENIECKNDWYKTQTFARIEAARNALVSAGNSEMRILVGCETEYDYEKHGVAITPETASKLDFVLAPNSHTHITMPKEFYPDSQKHAHFMLDAWMDIMNSKAAPYITAIPHPFLAVCSPYDNREVMRQITDRQFRDCFMAAKEKNIAVEINTSCWAEYLKNANISAIINDEAMRMYFIAKECGCKFTFGSDAHSISQIRSIPDGYIVASILSLTDEDILKI